VAVASKDNTVAEMRGAGDECVAQGGAVAVAYVDYFLGNGDALLEGTSTEACSQSREDGELDGSLDMRVGVWFGGEPGAEAVVAEG